MKRVHRSSIHKAPYNPRAISPAAYKSLETGIKKFGLVMPLVVNETTGHLVSGHQRLDVLDSQTKTLDYWLDVAMIEQPEKEEKALNVFLNNELAQGHFDEETLAAVLKDIDYDPSSGFDIPDIELMFGEVDAPYAKEALDTISQDLEKMAVLNPPETPRQHDKKPEQQWSPYTQDNVKRDSVAGGVDEITKTAMDPNFYMYVVFLTRNDREEFLRLLGESEEGKYVNGSRLLETVRELRGQKTT